MRRPIDRSRRRPWPSCATSWRNNSSSLQAAAVQHDRLAGGLGARRGVALAVAVAADIARVVVLGAAGGGIADLAMVDAVDAVVAALALTDQIAGDVGVGLGAAIATVDGAQHADRNGAAVEAVLVGIARILLGIDLDGTAATAGQRDVYLRRSGRRTGDRQHDRQKWTDCLLDRRVSHGLLPASVPGDFASIQGILRPSIEAGPGTRAGTRAVFRAIIRA